jgi:hypothetical protein
MPQHLSPDGGIALWQRFALDGVGAPAGEGRGFRPASIVVRDGKGQQDRVTILPRCFQPRREHLTRVQEQHDKGLADGFGKVYLWPTLEREYPHAARQ